MAGSRSRRPWPWVPRPWESLLWVLKVHHGCLRCRKWALELRQVAQAASKLAADRLAVHTWSAGSRYCRQAAGIVGSTVAVAEYNRHFRTRIQGHHLAEDRRH